MATPAHIERPRPLCPRCREVNDWWVAAFNAFRKYQATRDWLHLLSADVRAAIAILDGLASMVPYPDSDGAYIHLWLQRGNQQWFCRLWPTEYPELPEPMKRALTQG